MLFQTRETFVHFRNTN